MEQKESDEILLDVLHEDGDVAFFDGREDFLEMKSKQPLSDDLVGYR